MTDVLKFITCGSVDDGKSTLIGRMLHDSHMIFDDQITELQTSSKKFGTTDEDIDFALLVDGLAAEREQGITIDIAYRYFKTENRRFIVADTPGHIQYTRNMATAASTADLAIILVDARQGILQQTKRHSYVVSMLGIKNVIIAINKMDIVDYSESIFQDISSTYKDFAKTLEFTDIDIIPISALKGDNICSASPKMPWYKGKYLFKCLETTNINKYNFGNDAFRMPVQTIIRPDLDFRGFSGTIASGKAMVGQEVISIPSGKKSKIKTIVTYKTEKQTANTGQAVTLTLEDEIDTSRGDLISSVKTPCKASDMFRIKILWMDDTPMVAGRQYIFKSSVSEQTCTLEKVKHLIDIDTMQHTAADNLTLNDIGLCNIHLNKKTAYSTYTENRNLGSFILIDRHTNHTIAMGMIEYAMTRSFNIQKQNMAITRAERAEQKQQKPCTIWMTGLSGAGKSTIANKLEQHLFGQDYHTITLDGDNVRHGLNKDLGFTEHDRAENIRRIAEVSKLMMDSGLIVIVSFISPFISERELAKDIIGSDNFIEVHIDTPLETAEKRDVKGLYKKARAGEIPNFTGISSPYEPPETPDIRVQTEENTAEQSAEQILSYLDDNKFLLR